MDDMLPVMYACQNRITNRFNRLNGPNGLNRPNLIIN